MEMNGLYAQMLFDIELSEWKNGKNLYRTEPMITYFSAMDELLEDQIWDAESWKFAESYVPYLKAVEKYLASKE